MFPEKYRDHQNIGTFKYRFRLSIFQINYSIDNIDYRRALLNRAKGNSQLLFCILYKVAGNEVNTRHCLQIEIELKFFLIPELKSLYIK
jgi:hypothetical protein